MFLDFGLPDQVFLATDVELGTQVPDHESSSGIAGSNAKATSVVTRKRPPMHGPQAALSFDPTSGRDSHEDQCVNRRICPHKQNTGKLRHQLDVIQCLLFDSGRFRRALHQPLPRPTTAGSITSGGSASAKATPSSASRWFWWSRHIKT